jgi:predicted dehydrogenase
MKLLIIGGGAVSEAFHIPAAIKLLGNENVFVSEPSKSRQEYIKSKYDLKQIYSDYKEILNMVDAVIIATPPHLHAEILRDCLDLNKSVMCEKPATLSSEEGFLAMQHKTKNISTGMCHTYRLFPNRVFVHELIKNGYFGDTIHININEGSPADWPTITGYCFRKELASGGVLMDAGIHSLDFILWCLGEIKSFYYIDDAIGGLESNASMQLKFENQSTADYRISRTCELSNTIEISGKNKKVILDIFEMNKIIENGNERELTADERGNIPLLDWSNIGEYQLKKFFESIKNNKPHFCSIEEGIRAVETIEYCYHQKKDRPLPTEAGIPGLRF